MLESLVIGLVGSVIGLFLGLGIAAGLKALVTATGIELPSGGLVFAPRTIIVSLGVGTLIALLASLRPAIRATRIEPIAAVREGAVLPASRFARYALPAALIVVAAADRALLLRRLRERARRSRSGSSRSSAGCSLLFVGVAMIASRVVRPLAYVLGAPGARSAARAGKLARQNAVRNPKRTASTAAAVMIGLALITFVAVLGQGFRTSFTGAVDELFIADYAVTTADSTRSDERGRRRR